MMRDRWTKALHVVPPLVLVGVAVLAWERHRAAAVLAGVGVLWSLAVSALEVREMMRQRRMEGERKP